MCLSSPTVKRSPFAWKAGIIIWVAFVLLARAAVAQSETLTINANPAEGGSLAGGGIYSYGTQVNATIQAADGWYVTNVVLSPSPFSLSGFDRQTIIARLSGTDPTLITNDAESFTLTNNTTITVTFAPLAPSIIQQPANHTTVVTGSSISWAVQANGRTPFTYQWQFQGTNLPGATAASLNLANLQPTNSGSYSVTVSNAYGMTNSVSAMVAVKDLLVLVNDQPVSNANFSALNFANIAFQSRFLSGSIFYTLDGSAPDFSGNYYGGAFSVNSSCTLRAIAYSADFSQSVLSDPLTLFVIPTYSLYLNNWGGGTITLNPPNGPYTRGTVVTLMASPAAGFSFMGWSGLVSGTNLTNTLLMNQDAFVGATFGTSLATATLGNGTVSVHPNASLYPFGFNVQLTAIPNPGSYFVVWGNAGSGTANPLSLYLYAANPSVSAVFSSLPTNMFSLTVVADGNGIVAANPSTNKYALGTTCVLTASAPYGQQFTGWSGDASGTANPLTLLMNTNKVIAAHFSHPTSLALQRAGTNVQLSISGIYGDTYQIQTSTNLVTWTPMGSNVVNFSGRVTFSDSTATNPTSKFYRTLAQ